MAEHLLVPESLMKLPERVPQAASSAFFHVSQNHGYKTERGSPGEEEVEESLHQAPVPRSEIPPKSLKASSDTPARSGTRCRLSFEVLALKSPNAALQGAWTAVSHVEEIDDALCACKKRAFSYLNLVDVGAVFRAAD